MTPSRGPGFVALGTVAITACASGHVAPAMPSQAEWDVALSTLEQLRRSEATRPVGAVVRVSLREPHTRQTWSARGAVAIDPHRALRMILVGPGGATALDVWATPEAWRFEVPAAHLLRRGGPEDDRSLPIGFFRWWFLSPLGGRLLTSIGASTGERFILRDGAATVDLTSSGDAHGRTIVASRLTGGVVDNLVAAFPHLAGAEPSLAFEEGDHATYDGGGSGVHVEVTVEARSDAPDPRAFRDPDEDPDVHAGGDRR